MAPPRHSRRGLFGVVVATGRKVISDRVMLMSAGLSYSAALSIAPLVIVTLGIAGIVADRERAQHYVEGEIARLIGPDAARLIEQVADSQHRTGSGVLATIVGAVTLLIGATAVFVQLQDGLNIIWNVEPRPGRSLVALLRKRLLSLAMVASLGFLMLVSLLTSAFLTAVSERLSSVAGLQVATGIVLHLGLSLVTTGVLFALVFRLLPDARTAWRDVWLGAAVTSALFHVGEWVIGQYLARTAIGSVYGAAGSLVVTLVWVYYSSLIVFAGAEFTQVWAVRRGEGTAPAAHARRGNLDAPRRAVAPNARR